MKELIRNLPPKYLPTRRIPGMPFTNIQHGRRDCLHCVQTSVLSLLCQTHCVHQRGMLVHAHLLNTSPETGWGNRVRVGLGIHVRMLAQRPALGSITSTGKYRYIVLGIIGQRKQAYYMEQNKAKPLPLAWHRGELHA